MKTLQFYVKCGIILILHLENKSPRFRSCHEGYLFFKSDRRGFAMYCKQKFFPGDQTSKHEVELTPIISYKYEGGKLKLMKCGKVWQEISVSQKKGYEICLGNVLDIREIRLPKGRAALAARFFKRQDQPQNPPPRWEIARYKSKEGEPKANQYVAVYFNNAITLKDMVEMIPLMIEEGFPKAFIYRALSQEFGVDKAEVKRLHEKK